ncbi:MAG: ferrochelatase [Dehalococcoidia bacterium]|nr:ferrochelatase [Dehalococcoidia bacterium]MYK26171.1 ferrochelatase [Dehalococcoidia bacterium]
MASPGTSGLLLLNLGTPRSPATRDVRDYLREFLSDPYVLDMPAPVRWLLLNLIILPFRPSRSAHAYRQIWSDRGSPLLVHSEELRRKVEERLGGDVAVELAMRYGEPAIAEALARLRAQGVNDLCVFPLYPQYSSAATESSVEAVRSAATGSGLTMRVAPAFFDHPRFIEAVAEAARPTLDATEPQRVVFSFHGLPERQVRKADGSGRCFAGPDCCLSGHDARIDCYRAQCFATAQAVADALPIPEEQRMVAFQSRFGRERWIRPHTDRVLAELAREGVRRVAVIMPGFVADCLETLEEIGIRGAATFREHGGEKLSLAPCVNASDLWADAVVAIARELNPGMDSSQG